MKFCNFSEGRICPRCEKPTLNTGKRLFSFLLSRPFRCKSCNSTFQFRKKWITRTTISYVILFMVAVAESIKLRSYYPYYVLLSYILITTYILFCNISIQKNTRNNGNKSHLKAKHSKPTIKTKPIAQYSPQPPKHQI